MHYEKFVSRVVSLTGYSKADAQRFIEAFFRALAESLPPASIRNLGSQLPEEIKEYLLRAEAAPPGTVDRFYERVAQLASSSPSAAEKLTIPIISVLHEAVSVGELRQVRKALPLELGDRLFRLAAESRPVERA